jgi:hypothetical protein
LASESRVEHIVIFGLELTDPRNIPAMSEGDTTQDPPKQSQSAPLINDPELQQLLEVVAGQMGGLSQEYALRRSLETVLAMYQSSAQGGQPIIRYARTKTEQYINLPGTPWASRA